MKLRLKELSFLPAAMMACFVIRSAITFDVLESALFSYATLGLIFLSFILACFFLFNEPLLSRFDLLAVLLLVSVGIVSAYNIREARVGQLKYSQCVISERVWPGTTE